MAGHPAADTDGIARARTRCSEDRECLLTAGVATEIVVDLWSIAISFNAGHRIRMVLSASSAPRFEVNPNDDGDLNQPSTGAMARPVLLFEGEHPSRLELPIYRGAGRPRRHHARDAS